MIGFARNGKYLNFVVISINFIIDWIDLCDELGIEWKDKQWIYSMPANLINWIWEWKKELGKGTDPRCPSQWPATQIQQRNINTKHPQVSHESKLI